MTKEEVHKWFVDQGWEADRYEALSKMIERTVYSPDGADYLEMRKTRIIFRAIACSIKFQRRKYPNSPEYKTMEWFTKATCYYSQMDEEVLEYVNSAPGY